MKQQIEIDVSSLYSKTGTARLADLESYISRARELAGEGNIITLTGPGPVWLYLKVAHALHGKARKLVYTSPVTGDVVIYDHSPD
jgi:hypothetical protein